MVNYIRTLLLNHGRAAAGPALPGEEYVPKSFVPRRLSGVVKLAWQALFGTNPERLFLNYRLRQLVPFLHLTELETLAIQDDARITYWPPAVDADFDEAFTVTARHRAATLTSGWQVVWGLSWGASWGTVALTPAGAGQPYVSGELTCDEGTGRCGLTWNVTATAAEEVTVAQVTPPVTTRTAMLTYSGNLSGPVTLGPNVKMRFRPLTIGEAWQVTARGRPRTDISVILGHAAGIVGADQDAVFLPGDTEPARTLRYVWNTHPVAGYRYGAMLLALAARIDESPQDA